MEETCRALREEELERWVEHVDEVFVHTPRAYFERHYDNDPWRNLDGIRVAVDNQREGRIASTVRVFVRRVLVHGRQLPCGGIGEVSTKADYRKRGLASRVLQDAEAWMREQGTVLSMLHTGSAAPLYRSLGWHSVSMHHSVIVAPLTSFAPADQAFNHRMIDVTVDDGDQLRRVARVHEAYARRFNGTFVRDDPNYWNKWIAYEFTRENAFSALATDQAGEVVGYASCFVKEAGDGSMITARVREFGAVDGVVEDDGGRALLGSLVRYLVNRFLDSVPSPTGNALRAPGGQVSLVYPSAIENYFRPSAEEVVADGERREPSLDTGTMIRALDAPGTEREVEETLRRRPSLSTEPEQSRGGPTDTSYLLFWETDGF